MFVTIVEKAWCMAGKACTNGVLPERDGKKEPRRHLKYSCPIYRCFMA